MTPTGYPATSPPPAALTLPAAAPPMPSPATTPVPSHGPAPAPAAMSPPEPESPPPPPLFGTPPSPPSYPPPPAVTVPRSACLPSAVGAGVIALPGEGFATFRLEVTPPGSRNMLHISSFRLVTAYMPSFAENHGDLI